MALKPCPAILALLLFSLLRLAHGQETRLLLEISRHGTRAPISSVLKADWMDGLAASDLTPVGLRQHYYAGKQLVKQFEGFFNQSISREEVWVRSSLRQRTILSANAHLIGVLPSFPTDKMPFHADDPRLTPPWLSMDMKQLTFEPATPTGYSPTAIYTFSKDEEEMLIPLSAETCPKGKKAAAEITQKYKQELAASPGFVSMLDEAAKRFGVDLSKEKDKFDACEKIADFVAHDYLNNPKPILDKTDPLFPRLIRCLDTTNVINYLDPRMHKLATSVLLKDVLTKIKAKAEGKDSSLRYGFYSTHDSVLAPILMAAGVIDAQCYLEDLKKGTYSEKCGIAPQPAASLVFELRSKANPKEGLEVLFYYDLRPVQLCGGPSCSLEQLEKFVKDHTLEDHKQQCRDESSPNPDQKKLEPVQPAAEKTSVWKIVFFVVSGILLAELLAILIMVMCKRRLQAYDKQSKKQNLNDSEYVEVEDVVRRKSSKIKIP